MRAVLAVLLLLTALLAGCAGGNDDDPEPTPSSSSTSSSGSTSIAPGTSFSLSSSSSTSTGGPANQAPTATLAASVNGTSVTFNLTGTDPEGDDLRWTLTFGDGNQTNGASLPGNATYVYPAAGNYTASLTVTDGTNVGNASVQLNLSAVAAGPTVQDFTAEIVPATNPACTSDTVPYDAVPGSFAEVAVVPGTIGRAFTATFDSGAAQDHVLFLDAAGEILLHVTTGLPSDADWIAAGTVPTGAAVVAFYGCAGLPSEGVVYHAG